MDAASLRALATRAPEDAARALARARRGEGRLRASPAELDSLTLDVAEALRASGHAAEALALLETIRERSPRSELEEALCAFVHGDDQRLAAVAERAGELSKVLGPLLALTGSDAAPVGRAPRGAPDELKLLYAASRAVEASAQGSRADLKRALTAVEQEPLRRRLRSAARLAEGRGSRGDVRELDDPAWPELRRLALIGYLHSDPEEAVFHVGVLDGPADMRHHAVAARAPALAPEEVAALALQELGAHVFERPQDAALVAAFTELRAAAADLDAASFDDAEKAFAQAIELGADLGECERGGWIARRERAEAQGGTAMRAFFDGSARYASRLEKDPRHRAAWSAVLLDRANARSAGRRDLSLARADIEAVRSGLGDVWWATPAMEARVEHAWAELRSAEGELAAAREHAERAVSLDRTSAEVWATVLELTPPEQLPARSREAAEATKLPAFERAAQHLEEVATRGRTPGAAANDLARRPQTSASDELAAIDCIAQGLNLPERQLFDLAALYILERRHGAECASSYLRARVVDPGAGVFDLLLAALDIGLHDEVSAFFSGLDASKMMPGLVEIVIAAREKVSAQLGDRLLGKLAPHLSRKALARAQRSTRAATPGPGSSQQVPSMFDHLHDSLHPEFCVSAYLDGLPFDGDEAAGPPPGWLPDPDDVEDLLAPEQVDEIIGAALAVLGVPRRAIRDVPYEERLAFAAEIVAVATPAELERRLAELLRASAKRRPSGKKRMRKKRTAR